MSNVLDFCRSTGRPRPLVLAMLLCGAFPAAAQSGSSYLGLVSEHGGYVQAEGHFIVREAPDSAVLLDLRAGRHEGGAKLSWNFVAGAEAEASPNKVGKVFAAFDRGRHGMEKLTFGTGVEMQRGFLGGYYSRRLSGARTQLFTHEDVQVSEITEDIFHHVDTTVTTTTTLDRFRAFDHGVGVRLGRYLADDRLLLSGGADHEWGRRGAWQSTLSAEIEASIASTPASLALRAEASRLKDPVFGRSNDERFWLVFRYRFGGGSAQTASASMLAPASATVTASVPRTETRTVSVNVPVSSEMAFGFDSSELSSQARTSLLEVAQQLQGSGHVPPIHITGHTCDIGDAGYNQRLSRRRALSVAAFLVSQGLPESDMLTEGAGEAAPRYPNTPEQRHLNRRVEIAYTVQQVREEVIELPGLPAQAEVAQSTAELAWLRRALRASMPHKQTISGYTVRDVSTRTETSRETTLDNNDPVAVNDRFIVSGRGPSVLDVLANDYDPDGHALEITGFSQPIRGSLELIDDMLHFTPYGVFGVDFFSYTISDEYGGVSTAQVMLIDP